MIVGQSNFLQSLGWALLNSLWQMALLWITYQLITALLRKMNASQKTALATSLLFTGFGWFIFTFFSIVFAVSPANGGMSSLVINSGNNEALNSWFRTTLPIASSVYLVLLFLPLYQFARNYRYVRVVRQRELGKANIDWRIFVRNIASQLGIKKPVSLWLSGIVTSPVTIGYLKPVILLPVAAVSQLTPQQVEAILLHELAHIRRYDYILNLVTRIIQAILYFNPFVKALVKVIEREREKSCDEIVMQYEYDAHGYATALLTLEKSNISPRPLAVAAGGKRTDLLHRIECMLGVEKKQVLGFNKVAGLFAGLLCFIAFNALLIVSRPVKTEEAVASLNRLSSPFYIYTGGGDRGDAKPIAGMETVAKTIVNDIKDRIREKTFSTASPAEPAPLPQTADAPEFAYSVSQIPGAFINVALVASPPAPQLKEYQEAQVEKAIQASRKVLEETQWKAIEFKMADAISTREKELLRCEYEKEMKNVDWNAMKDMLRTVYDRIEWQKVNEELNKALTEIRIDSVQQVYNQAIMELSSIQQQLCENNLAGIPDSDISLEAIEKGKMEIQQALNKLKKQRTKKIAHL